jgi:hypothetical protein
VVLLNGNGNKTLTAGGAPLLPLPLSKLLALAVVLKTALSYTSEVPCEKDLTEERNAYYNTENREQSHVFVLSLACRHRPLACIMRPGCFWVLS